MHSAPREYHCNIVSHSPISILGFTAYRYADTKFEAFQFPFVNTSKPPVNNIMIHMANAQPDVYTIKTD